MILVTGGTGLLGSHLLFELAKTNQKVRVLKRPNSDISSIKKVFTEYNSRPDLLERLEWAEGDVNDIFSLYDAMQGVDVIYHCAAIVSFLPSDKQTMFDINYIGTKNVVNVALDSGIKKLCHVSSTAAIGKTIDGNLINENTPWSLNHKPSNYGLSKHLAEMEVWRAVQEGLDAVIVNPSVIVGPGEWGRSSTNVFVSVWNGLRFYSTGGNAFVDVRDVVSSMIKLTNEDITAQRFLVVSENLMYKHFFEFISDALGKMRPNVLAQPWMSEVAWRLNGIGSSFVGKKPLITKETSLSAQSKNFYSNEKIKSIIGQEFIPIKNAVEHTASLFLREYSVR